MHQDDLRQQARPTGDTESVICASASVVLVLVPALDVEIFQARVADESFELCEHGRTSTQTAAGFRAALQLAKDLYAHELPEDET